MSVNDKISNFWRIQGLTMRVVQMGPLPKLSENTPSSLWRSEKHPHPFLNGHANRSHRRRIKNMRTRLSQWWWMQPRVLKLPFKYRRLSRRLWKLSILWVVERPPSSFQAEKDLRVTAVWISARRIGAWHEPVREARFHHPGYPYSTFENPLLSVCDTSLFLPSSC